jgi:hypothetical protein
VEAGRRNGKVRDLSAFQALSDSLSLLSQKLYALAEFHKIIPPKLEIRIGFLYRLHGKLGDFRFGSLDTAAHPAFMPLPETRDFPLGNAVDMDKLKQDQFLDIAGSKGPP